MAKEAKKGKAAQIEEARKAADVPAIQNERTVSGPVVIKPALLVDQEVELANVEGLPEEFTNSETLSGFPPSAKFEKKGDTVFGEFVGLRTEVGPNSSRLYELAVPKGDGETMTVAVWGSSALDRLFDSAYPPVQQGDRVAVIYLGEKGTRRAQNPVKLFALKIKREGQSVQTAEAQ